MICIILGILFLAAAVYLLQDWFKHQKRCTETVLATITAVEQGASGKHQRVRKNYYPVYSFLYQEKNYEVRPQEPSRSNRWKVGELVDLRFDPKDPDYFIVGKSLGDLIYGLIALLLCLLMAAIFLFG